MTPGSVFPVGEETLAITLKEFLRHLSGIKLSSCHQMPKAAVLTDLRQEQVTAIKLSTDISKYPRKKRSYLCPRFAFGDQSCSLKQSSGFIFLLASFRPSSADQLFSLSKLVFPQVKNEKLKTLERRRQAEVLGLPPTNVSSVLLPFFCVFISMSGFLLRIKTPFTLVGPNHGHVPGFKRTKTPRKARVRLSQSSRYEQQ